MEVDGEMQVWSGRPTELPAAPEGQRQSIPLRGGRTFWDKSGWLVVKLFSQRSRADRADLLGWGRLLLRDVAHNGDGFVEFYEGPADYPPFAKTQFRPRPDLGRLGLNFVVPQELEESVPEALDAAPSVRRGPPSTAPSVPEDLENYKLSSPQYRKTVSRSEPSVPKTLSDATPTATRRASPKAQAAPSPVPELQDLPPVPKDLPRQIEAIGANAEETPAISKARTESGGALTNANSAPSQLVPRALQFDPTPAS